MADETPAQPPPPATRPLLHPTNLRFGLMLLVIILVGFATRLNACDYRTIAKRVIEDPAVGTLKTDVAGVGGRVDAVAAQARGLSASHEQLAAGVAALQASVDTLIAHSPRTIYRYNPDTQKSPDAAQLKALRAAVAAGAKISVTHRPAEGIGRVISVRCAFVGLDANGNVQCMSAVLAANSELPDGRRYQEILTHDGTRVLAHWNADGTNIQGEREVEKRETHWTAELPF